MCVIRLEKLSIFLSLIFYSFFKSYYVSNITSKKKIKINKYIKYFVFSVIIDDPEFTEPIVNVTVPAGRSVKLGCSVRNLGSYKVCYFFSSEIEYVLNTTYACIRYSYIHIYVFLRLPKPESIILIEPR